MEEEEEAGWQTGEENCISTKNIEGIKNSLFKKRNKQKSRGKRIHSFDGTPNSEAEVSKVIPRFNLRDRKTIKKVFS